MALSNDLVSQFVRLSTPEPEKKAETTVYGTVRIVDGKTYVRIDGSSIDTPVSESTTTFTVNKDDRVMVLIKDHSAIITGNMTSPSATQKNLDETKNDVESKLTSFDKVVANKVDTETFKAEQAKITELQAKNVEITGQLNATKADIETLNADNVTIKGKLTAHEGQFDTINTKFITVDGELEAAAGKFETLEATDADFRTLESDYADFKEVNADIVDAETGKFKNFSTQYATIEFGNITEAAIVKLFTESGIIENLVVSEGQITGQLVGVTIKGDLIEAGTLKADRLVVLGSDGNYYKINTDFNNIVGTDGVPVEPVEEDRIHGSTLVAKSLTAEKIAVEDLVAFGATIGGFHITGPSVDENGNVTVPGMIYSGTKESVMAPYLGVYMDADGQVSIGDTSNYFRYYRVTDENGAPVLDDNGNAIYKLEISAESIMFGSESKSSAADLKALTEHVRIGTYINPETGNEQPSVELAEGDSSFKQVITNTKTMFMDGDTVKTEINTDGVETNNVTVRGELRHVANRSDGIQGQFVWATRPNGNYGLMWKKTGEVTR